MQVLVIGDPHFKVGNVQESEEMTKKLVLLAQERQPKIIVCLGDILHRHETIHVSPLMRAERMIKDLSQVAPTFLIIGNHDRPNNSDFLSDRHPFNALKEWPNTYIVDQVLDVHIEDNRFIFVPYVPPGKFIDALETKQNPLTNTVAIFAHQEFYGAKMGAIKSLAGDKWSTDYPLVISGHIHDYDRLQDNIIYVGTPMQHAFGDRSDKTISIFTFNNNEWSEERVDLGLIKRIIVYLTVEQVHTYIPPEDKLVKLVIKGDVGGIKSVSQLEKIKELKKLGVKISFKTIIEDCDKEEHKVILRLSYKDGLYSKINKDPDQAKWFNTLFP